MFYCQEPEAVCAKVKDCREMLASALENFNEPEQETPVVMEMQQEGNFKVRNIFCVPLSSFLVDLWKSPKSPRRRL